LWHAAKWTFILWGIYHGLILVMHRVGQQLKRKHQLTMPPRFGAFLAWAATFLVISLGWVFFRANSLAEALSMFGTVFNPAAYGHLGMPRNFYILILITIAAYFAYDGAHSILMSWAGAYKATSSGAWPVRGLEGLRLNAGGLFNFFDNTLWWWFAPTVAILTAFVGIAMYQQSAVISVTPFIYTLF